MTNQTESLLRSILAELQAIHQLLSPPKPMSEVELEHNLSVALGTGPEEFGNH
jgi:hypothetical protein